MIAIKKIEVTPLDYNEGKIIDSATSTDDKTKNTYSMQIVDNKISEVNQSISEVESDVSDLTNNVYVKGDYAVLTGSITMTDGEAPVVTISYPNGFTKDNTFVLSCLLQRDIGTDGTSYSEGIIPDISGLVTGAIYRRVSLFTTGIAIDIKSFVDGQGSGTYDYKILLLKVS